jgi:NADH-quinone oxidoreductase subunit A
VSYDVYSQAYLTVAVFVFAAVGMVALMLGLASLLRPSLPSESKLTPYESGVDPVPGFGQAHVRYYIYALLFVIFDIEAAFVFPWATEAEALGFYGYWAMSLFIVILLLGLLYDIKKGLLSWA